MLTLLFAAILPVAAAEPEPEPEEAIQDFSYQTSANFAVGRASTELRFVFTIGSLDRDLSDSDPFPSRRAPRDTSRCEATQSFHPRDRPGKIKNHL